MDSCPLYNAARLLVAALALMPVGACSRRHSPSRADATTRIVATAGTAALARSEPEHDAGPRPLHRCLPDTPVWTDAPVDALLDRAAAQLDHGDNEAALACAEEAARQAPASVEAHQDRALALLGLGRLDDARDAVTLLLAMAPQDPEALELAANFYINHLPPSAEHSSIGLEYARRGGHLPAAGHDQSLRAQLALLEGQALIDLGRAQEALRPLTLALRLAPDDQAAHYERGVAWFELCRFEAAQRELEAVVAADPTHAYALFHLGLIAERSGKESLAEQRFAEASKADPSGFPPVPSVSLQEFSERTRRTVAHLPADVQKDLATIKLEIADLPNLEDLTAEVPPLSPTILGLYRGLPLGREDTNLPAAPARGRHRSAGRAHTAGQPAQPIPARAVVVYRRNILRSARSLAEVDQVIERTLLHEVGHLRGEDDGSLRDRGLE